MRLPNISKDILEIFLKVADEKSINSAAKLLFIDASSISRRLTHLESDCGVQLISRTSSGVTLTENGQIFYQYAQNFFADLSELSEKFSKEKFIRIGSFDSISSRVFPSFFSNRLDLSLITNDTKKLTKAFNSHDLEAVIMDSEFSDLLTGKFFEQRLFDEPYYLISKAANKTDLAGMELLLHPKTCPIYQKLLRVLNSEKLPHIHEIEFSQSALSFVENSDMATILPESAIESSRIVNSGLHLTKLDPAFDRHLSLFSSDEKTSEILVEALKNCQSVKKLDLNHFSD